MYAPICPSDYAIRSGRKVWHKVRSLDLASAVCNPKAVLNGNEMRDELPPDAEYCQVCERRERFA